ncbi:hypothetical protein, partial [uncultured Dokdonia sp.]|uniref:hypothetical protein n=1 Tax=uncultured Dokdonia sp. TaxID=575653 RepID=UPI00260E960B
PYGRESRKLDLSLCSPYGRESRKLDLSLCSPYGRESRKLDFAKAYTTRYHRGEALFHRERNGLSLSIYVFN